MLNINIIAKNLCIAVFVCISGVASAMPGTAHNAGTSLLLETPWQKGGAKALDSVKVAGIHTWMDYPSKWLGPHHNRIRHNPIRATRALSGTGKINPAKLNIARMHKIQDVYFNTNPVDGWKLTSKMKQQAGEIIAYANRKKGLPSRLPVWVDQTAPSHANSARKLNKSVNKTSSKVSQTAKVLNKADDVSRAAKVVSKAGKYAGPAGVTLEVGFRGFVAYNTEQKYREGEITLQERNVQHSRNGGAAAGGAAGALGGAKGGALAGGAIGACFGGVGAPVGAGIGGIIGAVSGGFLGDFVGGKTGAFVAREASD